MASPTVTISPAQPAACGTGRVAAATTLDGAPPGYNKAIEKLQEEEFTRFKGKVYCDYGGCAPYSEAMLRQACEQLCGGVYGNPHSGTDAATIAAEKARRLTLAMCNASEDDYACIFTAGATAALKLVAECFPWEGGDSGVCEGAGVTAEKAPPNLSHRKLMREQSLRKQEEQQLLSQVSKKLGLGEGATRDHGIFLYLRDNHNSVLGIRQLAKLQDAEAVAAVEFAPVANSGGAASSRDECDNADSMSPSFALRICNGEAAADIIAAGALKAARTRNSAKPSSAQHLLAFPLESNFSGTKYTLDLVNALHEGRVALQLATEDEGSAPVQMPLPAGRWRVMVDCAKGATTTPPDLSRFPADFVAISYYKMFGYPTGLGALVARKEALTGCLRKRYFGGGTVVVVSADDPYFMLKSGVSAWEDGSLHFLAPPTICAGFDFIQRLGGFPAIYRHANVVADRLAAQLAAMRHANGAPVAALYRADLSAPGVAAQGPVVSFNLKRADGSWIGCRTVEDVAHERGIHLRTGCSCNPGACSKYCGFSLSNIKTYNEAGHQCGDGPDVWEGLPFGAVRCTFGFHSTLADADTVARMVRECFVEGGGSASQPQTASAGKAEE